MKTKWNEKSTADKIMRVLRIIISVAVLAGAVLQIKGVWDKALNVAIPLLSVLILIQSIQEHKEQKKASSTSMKSTRLPESQRTLLLPEMYPVKVFSRPY